MLMYLKRILAIINIPNTCVWLDCYYHYRYIIKQLFNYKYAFREVTFKEAGIVHNVAGD